MNRLVLSLALIANVTSAVLTTAFSAADESTDTAAGAAGERVDFTKQIMPLLQRSCVACHREQESEGGLVLESFAALMKGGDSGPGVIAKDHAGSLLWSRASGSEEPIMPPEDNTIGAKPLSPAELNLIKLWIDQGAAKGSVETARSIHWESLSGSLQPIYAVANSGDGRFAAVGRGNQVAIYDHATGVELAQLIDPSLKQPATGLDIVQSLAFSPDGERLASGDFRTVRLWRRSDRRQEIASTPFVHATGLVVASQDASKVAWVNGVGEIEIWDLQANRHIARLRGPDDSTYADMDMTLSGEQLFTGNATGRIMAWNAVDGSESMRFETGSSIIRLIASDDGKLVATMDAQGHVRLYRSEAASAAPALTLVPAEFPVISSVADASEIRFTRGPAPDLLIASGAGKVLVVSCQSGMLSRTLEQGAPVVALGLNSDASQAAVSSADGRTQLWVLKDGEKSTTLQSNAAFDYRLNVARRDLARLEAEVARQTARVAELETFATNEATAQGKIQSERDKAAEALAVEDTKLAEAAALVKATGATIAKAQTEVETAKKALAESEKLVADLAAQLSKMNGELAAQKAAQEAATSQKNAADAAADSISAADAKIAQATAETATIEATILKTTTDLEAAKQKVALATKSVADATAKLTPLTAELEKQTAALKEAETKRQMAAALLAQHDKTLDNARAATDRAKAAIPAQAGIVALHTRRAAFEKRRLSELEQHAASMQSAVTAISFTQAHIVTSHQDGALCVYRAVDGAWISRSPVYTDGATDNQVIRIIPLADDKILAARASGAPAVISVKPSWILERVIGGPELDLISDRVTAIDFRPDGLSFAVGSGEPSRFGDVRLFSTATGELIRDLGRPHSDTVLGLRFSPDGKRLASSAADRTVRILNLASGEVERSLEGHTHHVLALAWQDDGIDLATAGADQTVKVWDSSTGSQRRTISGFPKEVTSIAFLSNTTQIVTTCGDGNVRLHDTKNGSLLRTMNASADFLHSLASPMDGQTVVAGGQSGQLRVWSTKDGKLLREMK